MHQRSKKDLLLIRADADSQIGSGHVMRCIALAQAWLCRGGDVIFFGNIKGSALQERIITEGCQFMPLDTPWPDPTDLVKMQDLLNDLKKNPWIVLDGYHFTPEYQRHIKNFGCRTLIIDDMAHQASYHADIILNPNIYAKAEDYTCCDTNTRLLMGARYALIRDEFIKKKNFKEIPDRAKHILVTMGGADPDNATLTVIKALKAIEHEIVKVRVIIGFVNPNRESVENEIDKKTFEILNNVDDMPALMNWTDIAVTAGGSTCGELAFMGVPFAALILADNQRENAQCMADLKAAINLGDYQYTSSENIYKHIRKLIDNKKKRARFISNAQRLIDGKGPQRVIETMLSSILRLRFASQADCLQIFLWANDPATRKASFQTDKITWEHHKKWYTSKLNDPSTAYYIATDGNGTPLGQARFEIIKDEAVISVSLDKKFRKAGIGARLIEQSSQDVLLKKGVSKITARIKPNNPASIKAFKNAGFKQSSEPAIDGAAPITMFYGGKKNGTAVKNQ